MMTANDREDRAWDLAEKVGMCMLATHDGQRIRARPMAPTIRREEGAIYFLTDSGGHKDEEIAQDAEVCLTFADTGPSNYVSLSGRAEVLDDRSLVHELWTPAAKAFWDSPDDPSIRVLRVAPDFGEYWDGSGRVASTLKLAAAALTGAKPDMGDNAKVRM
jgi:general stress protein 26